MKLTSAGDGNYRGSGQVPMAGKWNVTIGVKRAGKLLGQKKTTLSPK